MSRPAPGRRASTAATSTCEVTELFRGYRLAPSSRGRGAWPRPGCGAAGREPREVVTGGGSDANALIAGGLRLRPARQRHRGEPHQPRRASPPRSLDAMLDVCEAIVELEAGTLNASAVDAEAAPRHRRRRGAADGRGRRRAARPPGRIRGWSGEVREGDEVIVNVEALDLGLGSGGIDIVHANLSAGARGRRRRRAGRDQAQLHLDPAPRRPGRAQRGRGRGRQRRRAPRCW